MTGRDEAERRGDQRRIDERLSDERRSDERRSDERRSDERDGDQRDGDQRCPECGVTRPPNAAPTCGCARRATEEARRTRSAEAAAAEDFDPIRIRPYVSLTGPATEDLAPGGDAEGAGGLAQGPAAPQGDPVDVREEPPPAAIAAATATTTTTAEATTVGPRKRNRPYALVAGAGVLAAVVAAGVLATGLLSSAAEQPGRDHALPLAPTSAPAADPTKPVPPSAESPTRSSAAPSTKPRVAAPPPSPARRSSEPPSSSPPPPTARATGSVRTTPPPRREPTAHPVLAEGDEGPQVAELQERLAQLHLYAGEPDGAYTRQVRDAVARYQWARGLTDDPPGEYGPETRRSLEGETKGP